MVSRGKLFEAETTEHLQARKNKKKTVFKREKTTGVWIGWDHLEKNRKKWYAAFLEVEFGGWIVTSLMSLINFY